MDIGHDFRPSLQHGSLASLFAATGACVHQRRPTPQRLAAPACFPNTQRGNKNKKQGRGDARAPPSMFPPSSDIKVDRHLDNSHRPLLSTPKEAGLQTSARARDKTSLVPPWPPRRTNASHPQIHRESISSPLPFTLQTARRTVGPLSTWPLQIRSVPAWAAKPDAVPVGSSTWHRCNSCARPCGGLSSQKKTSLRQHASFLSLSLCVCGVHVGQRQPNARV